MINGIRIEKHSLMPAGVSMLTRYSHGHLQVVGRGKLEDMIEHYRQGDLIVVADDVWYNLQSHFAKDVTPKQEGS